MKEKEKEKENAIKEEILKMMREAPPQTESEKRESEEKFRENILKNNLTFGKTATNKKIDELLNNKTTFDVVELTKKSMALDIAKMKMANESTVKVQKNGLLKNIFMFVIIPLFITLCGVIFAWILSRNY